MIFNTYEGLDSQKGDSPHLLSHRMSAYTQLHTHILQVFSSQKSLHHNY
jgi:hypothetical protein